MERDLTDLGRMLSLTEEESDKVNIPSEIWQKRENLQLTLVGRVLSRKWVNFEALRVTLFRMLNPGKGMRIQSLNAERFLLTLTISLISTEQSKGDHGLLTKQLIVLHFIGENQDPTEVCLDWCTFTVFIHDLPYG
ncbi:hypothetical protein Salat_0620600 [Sesamum alatum]|uniref:Uncharacterized protein n=1 Tax=Sesamum alatum TaxID=300844 RepID=A0AAE1YRZ9_9LAMI|nr:hypothetical protein Salat_0620600 [Sesamum alatum]